MLEKLAYKERLKLHKSLIHLLYGMVSLSTLTKELYAVLANSKEIFLIKNPFAIQNFVYFGSLHDLWHNELIGELTFMK